MIHRDFSEPDVILLVILLRTVLFESLRRSGVLRGSSIGGLEVESLRSVGLTTLTATGRDENKMVNVDIIKCRS